MKFDFDEPVNRENTNSVKYDLREKLFGRHNILPMWVADMDFKVPPAVAQAIQDRARHQIYGYSIRPESFYESAVGWMNRRHGWSIDRSWLTFTPGIVPGVNLAIMALTEPGDKVMIQPPVYFPFFHGIRKNNREIIENRLILKNGRYHIDLDDFENQLKNGVRMFILSNPHNPGGSVWTYDELKQMGELCAYYGATIIADEIHNDIVFPGHHYVPMASISDEIAEHTITFIALSKTFNIAGLATSVGIISNKALREAFNQMLERTHVANGNLFGTVAMEAAYNHGDQWLDELLQYLVGNLDLIEQFTRERLPGIELVRPEGTYLAWLDCRSLPVEAKQLNQFMIDKAQVGMNDGASFGQNGAGFQRLNFGCPRQTLTKALTQMEHAVKHLNHS
jgi:cystathionine beta-lyase